MKFLSKCLQLLSRINLKLSKNTFSTKFDIFVQVMFLKDLAVQYRLIDSFRLTNNSFYSLC